MAPMATKIEIDMMADGKTPNAHMTAATKAVIPPPAIMLANSRRLFPFLPRKGRLCLALEAMPLHPQRDYCHKEHFFVIFCYAGIITLDALS